MKISKKILIYLSIIIVITIMFFLFYYSMSATLKDYFFESSQEQREKITPAASDQAQIMVDLANKQMAKEKAEIEIRNDEGKNKSLFKELSGNQATIKTQPVESSDNEAAIVPDSTATPELDVQLKTEKRNHVQNGYVVVDCEKGGVIACPHYDVQTGTSPLFYQKDKSQFLVGRCLDVSIDVKTFCP